MIAAPRKEPRISRIRADQHERKVTRILGTGKSLSGHWKFTPRSAIKCLTAIILFRNLQEKTEKTEEKLQSLFSLYSPVELRRDPPYPTGDEQRDKKESRKGAKTQRVPFTSVFFSFASLRLCVMS